MSANTMAGARAAAALTAATTTAAQQQQQRQWRRQGMQTKANRTNAGEHGGTNSSATAANMNEGRREGANANEGKGM